MASCSAEHEETAEFTAYLAPEGYEQELREELGEVSARYGRLLLSPGPAKRVAWVSNIWFKPRRLPVLSIADAARQLRALQRNWALYAHAHHRRATLIAGRLPHISAKPLAFPAPAPSAPLGSWTLLDERTVLAASRCSSAFPNGEIRFLEDRRAPPSRAYLKLWEAFTVLGRWPQPGERCLDLGSSPGGWTWVLAGLGARVLSVDKAPVDPRIAAMPGVEVRRQSAFGLAPETVGPVDWLCSDVVCYPERLLGLVRRWLRSGLCQNFVCTLKFQGATDHGIAAGFAETLGGRLVHLHQNKHELTWMRFARG